MKKCDAETVSKNTPAAAALMAAIGSKKGYDPFPPDQYLTYLDRRYSPVMRLWAWMLAHTIAKDHRSPWAVDDKGRTLSIADAAKSLKIDERNLRRHWTELETEGRVQRCGKKLHIKGEVNISDKFQGRTESEARVCTNPLPPYILLQINKLEENEKERFWKAFNAVENSGRELIRESVSAVRTIIEHQKDSIFGAFGIKKNREVKTSEPSPLLPAIAGFVQTRFSEIEDLYKGENQAKGGSVQRAHIRKTTETTEKNLSAAAENSVVSGKQPPPTIITIMDRLQLPLAGQQKAEALKVCRGIDEAGLNEIGRMMFEWRKGKRTATDVVVLLELKASVEKWKRLQATKTDQKLNQHEHDRKTAEGILENSEDHVAEDVQWALEIMAGRLEKTA